MDVLVNSGFRTKLLSSLQAPSFAGSGLPERMRTTAFAFLGLTAAAGLAFVAIFAQLSFPLLSPAPLPSDPSRENAVAEAVALQAGRSAPAISDGGSVTLGERGTDGGTAGGGGSSRNATPADSPPPAASPDGPASAGGRGGSGTGAPATSPGPGSAPAGTPEAQPIASPPSGSSSTLAPGNSSSSAAASNASKRGIEASSKGSPGAKGTSGSKTSSAAKKATSATAESPAPVAEDTSQAGTPHGKAKGHSK
ncbi:MAG TPA: hypothetical protein VFM51_01270 [Solirubrobacterales bacterium]|nr:hypothetical protein [Solirubrobacterales bacterium]